MADPATLDAALVAAQAAIDAADAATLQAFTAQYPFATTPIQTFLVAFAALAPALADVNRQRLIASYSGQINVLTGQFGDVVAQAAQAAAAKT